MRTAVVLIGFARVQNRLLFNQAGMTDLLCLTVSVGDFPKTLTQSNDFITAVADGNQIIEGVAVAVDVALAGHITWLHVNLDFIHNCLPRMVFILFQSG